MTTKLAQGFSPYLIIFVTFFNYIQRWTIEASTCLEITCPRGNDSGTYYNQFLGLLDHTWPNTAFYFSPLYPYYLKLLHSVFQYPIERIAIPTLIQIFLVTLTSAMAYSIAKNLFSREVGLVAILLIAFFNPIQEYALFLETPILLTTFVTATIYFLIEYQKRQNRTFLVIAAICLGLAVIGRQSNLVIIGAIGLWLMLLKTPPKRILADIAIICLFVFIIMAPSVLFNSLSRGYFVAGVITDGLINYTMGNVPNAPGTYYKPKNDYTVEMMLKFITTQPGSWLLLTLRKFYFFTMPWLWVRALNNNFYKVSFDNLPLHWLIGWGIFVIIYLFYFFKTFSLKRSLVHFSLIFYTISLVLAHVENEFRIPILPLVLIFFSAMLLDLARSVLSALPKLRQKVRNWHIQRPIFVSCWSLLTVIVMLRQVPSAEVSQKIALVSSPPIFGGVLIGQRFKVDCPNLYQIEVQVISENPNGSVIFRINEDTINGSQIYSQEVSTLQIKTAGHQTFTFPAVFDSAGKYYVFTFDTAGLETHQEGISLLGVTYPLKFDHESQMAWFDRQAHLNKPYPIEAIDFGTEESAFISQQNVIQNIRGNVAFTAYCKANREQLVRTAINRLAETTPMPNIVKPLIVLVFLIHCVALLVSIGMIVYRTVLS